MRNATKALAFLLLLLASESHAAEKVRFVPVLSVYTDSKGAGLREPEGVTCNESSLVVVADTANGRLVRYNFLENRTIQGGDEIRAPELLYPVHVQMNSRGEIFALDGRLRRIVRFGTDGAFAGYLAPAELPEPSAFVPASFAVDRSDNFYLLDVLGERVLVLDPGGKYLSQIPLPKKGGSFLDVASDLRGTVYVLDTVNATVYSATRDAREFSPLTKSLKEDMNFPTDLTVDGNGILYLVDRNGAGVAIVGPDGTLRGRQLTRGPKEGLLDYPSQLCITSKGDAFLADRGNNRVQVFSLVRE